MTFPCHNAPKDIHEQFQIIENHLLGKGSFATVYLAKRKPSNILMDSYNNNGKEDQCVALKCINIQNLIIRRRKCQELKQNAQPHILSKRKESLLGDETRALFRSSISPRQDLDNKPAFSEEKDRDAIMAMLQREVSVHLSVSSPNGHRNIVSILGSSLDRQTKGTQPKFMTIALEYCPLGDLQLYMRRIRAYKMNQRDKIETSNQIKTESSDSLLSEDEVRHALRDIMQGLAFLHSRGIVHRDIKAGNVFLTTKSGSLKEDFVKYPAIGYSLFDCLLKIGDFGLAVQMSYDDNWDDAQHTICGTPSCLAPEVALSTSKKESNSGVLKHQTEQDGFVEEKRGILNNIESTFFEMATNELSKNGDDEYEDTILKNNKEEKNDGSIDSSLDADIRTLIDEHTSGKGHGQPADLWSVGCLLYAMLVGKYPFSSNSRNPNVLEEAGEAKINVHSPPVAISKTEKVRETIRKIINGEWSIPSDIYLSKAATSLIHQLLSSDPHQRGFARGVLNQHAFFKTTTSNLGSSQQPNLTSQKSRNVPNGSLQKQKHKTPSILGNQFEVDKINSFSNKENELYNVHVACSSHKKIKSYNLRCGEFDTSEVEKPLQKLKISPHIGSNRSLLRRIESTLGSTRYNFDSKEPITPLKTNVSIKLDKFVPGTNENRNIDSHKNNQSLATGINGHFVIKSEQSNCSHKEVKHKSSWSSNSNFTPKNLGDSNSVGISQKAETKKIDSAELEIQKDKVKLINPIENIHRLPAMRHQWKEIRRKTNEKKKTSKHRCFTIFILSGGYGLVIKCEEESRRGAWLYVTRDGQKVCFGRLSSSRNENKPPIISGKTDAFQRNMTSKEAFDGTAIDLENININTPECGSNQNENDNRNLSSFCTSTTTSSYFSNTCFSAHSVPTPAYYTRKKTKYNALSSLLLVKNSPFLSIYRKLEKMIRQVKKHTPKIILYVHANNEQEKNIRGNATQYPLKGRLLCKALLMENEPYPTVEIIFVDGVFILFEMSLGIARLASPNCKKGNAIEVEFCVEPVVGAMSKIAKKKEGNMLNLREKDIFNFHIQLAQTAVEMCLLIEKRVSESTFGHASEIKKSRLVHKFPVTRKVVAAGNVCTDWIDITNQKDLFVESNQVGSDHCNQDRRSDGKNTRSGVQVESTDVKAYLFDDGTISSSIGTI